jgi:AraC-like DNA-binding protein
MKKQLSSPIKYLTVNEDDINWGLTVTTVGYQSVSPDSRYPSKDHPSRYWFNPDTGRVLQEYQLIYITRGQGYFSSGELKKTEVGEGTIFLLFPNEWHSYLPKIESGWDTYWIGFKGVVADQLIRHHFFGKQAPLHPVGFNEQLLDLFKQAIALAREECAGFQQAIAGIAMHMLGAIYFITKNNQFQDKEIVTKIEKARLLMREHPDGSISPEELAARLNMSYSWFRRMFKQYTGLSPTQYQQQIRLQQAKDLLVSSGKTIKEIAYELNFESANYFTAFFKQNAGFTPAVFRKRSHQPVMK